MGLEKQKQANYRTSNSSCSNHSYLNASLMANHNMGASYNDVFGSRENKMNGVLQQMMNQFYSMSNDQSSAKRKTGKEKVGSLITYT